MIKMNSLSHTQYKSNKASQQRSNKPDKKQKWLTFNSIEEVIQYISEFPVGIFKELKMYFIRIVNIGCESKKCTRSTYKYNYENLDCIY